MQSFLQVTGRLLLLQSGPQDMPFSTTLLVVAAFANLITNVVSLSVTAPIAAALPQAVVAVLVSGLFVLALLQIRDRKARAVQAVTALFATQAALATVAIFPLQALAPFLQAVAENPDAASTIQPPSMAFGAWLALGIWSVMVTAHILRHALDVRLLAGVGLAILQGIVIWVVYQPFASSPA